MKHNLTEQEFRVALDETKVLLSEAAAKGALNDFWVVIDCDSENFRDYLFRSNTQGLIDIVCKKHKALCTRKVLNDIALFAAGDKDKAEKEAKRRAKNMKVELVNEKSGCDKCAKAKDALRAKASAYRKEAHDKKGDQKVTATLILKAKDADKAADDASCESCKATVNESGCAGCARNKEDHLAAAKKAEHEAKMLGRHNPEAAKAMASKAKMEKSLANEKCGACRKASGENPGTKVYENHYAPRNTVAAKGDLASSTDDTVYSANPSERMDRVSGAKPGPHDPTTPEHKDTVKVPSSITKVLESRAKDAREHSEKLPVTHTDDKQFYSDLATMFEDLNSYLKSGTTQDIKMANVFMNTLMGPMLNEIPTEVSRFITYGGSHAPLKSFVNSITVPQGGYGIGKDGTISKGKK